MPRAPWYLASARSPPAASVNQWVDVAELEDTTHEWYEDLVRIYIGPAFGELAAGKLDSELLGRFYARL